MKQISRYALETGNWKLNHYLEQLQNFLIILAGAVVAVFGLAVAARAQNDPEWTELAKQKAAVQPSNQQQPGFQDALLDKMAGTWVLRGTIAGAETTHDITAEWVLGHQ